MERYLLDQNKFFVLAGSCNSSDAESNDIPNQWDVSVDWNKHDSKFFTEILRGTRTKALDLEPELDEIDIESDTTLNLQSYLAKKKVR